MTDEIVTARLRGTPVAEADFADLHDLHRDPRVLAAFDSEPLTEAETRRWLDARLAQRREHGLTTWLFRDAAGSFVGRCHLRRMTLRGESVVELGYIVRWELWSQGYATEMARAVADHGFGSGVCEIVALTSPGNAGSRRVLEKAGFAFDGQYVNDYGEPEVVYRLSKSSG